MDSIFSQYETWLMEQNETQATRSFREYLEATYPGEVAFHNQMIIAEMVAGNVSRASAAQALASVTAEADTDLGAGLTALARSRVSRIANTMRFIDQVEGRLMRRINIEEASIDQLLAAGRLLRTSAADDTKLVAEVLRAREEKPTVPASFTVNFNENIQNIGNDAARLTMQSRDSRDRARTVLDSFIKTVQKSVDPPANT